MNGYLDKVIYGWPILIIGWFEVRVRGKVSHRTFDATIIPMQKREERIESHLYDLLKERHITPTMDVPDGIKNNAR